MVRQQKAAAKRPSLLAARGNSLPLAHTQARQRRFAFLKIVAGAVLYTPSVQTAHPGSRLRVGAARSVAYTSSQSSKKCNRDLSPQLTLWSRAIHAAKQSFVMPSKTLKNFPSIAIFIFAACASAQSLCPVDEVIVKGRIDHLPTTQSREPMVNGSFGRCGRRLITVIVTLLDGERKREYACIFLDFANEFKRIDSSTYGLKSDVLLKGPQ